jgi:hypothetical protein
LAGLFFFAGIGLLGLAAYAYFGPAPERVLALEIAETKIEIPECVTGQRREVVLHLENNSGHPMRILGKAMS